MACRSTAGMCNSSQQLACCLRNSSQETTSASKSRAAGLSGKPPRAGPSKKAKGQPEHCKAVKSTAANGLRDSGQEPTCVSKQVKRRPAPTAVVKLKAGLSKHVNSWTACQTAVSNRPARHKAADIRPEEADQEPARATAFNSGPKRN